MSEATGKIRADLDAAIDSALPLAGYRVRGALQRLRNELADVDRRNMAADERSANWPDWVRQAVLTPASRPYSSEGGEAR